MGVSVSASWSVKGLFYVHIQTYTCIYIIRCLDKHKLLSYCGFDLQLPIRLSTFSCAWFAIHVAFSRETFSLETFCFLVRAWFFFINGFWAFFTFLDGIPYQMCVLQTFLPSLLLLFPLLAAPFEEQMILIWAVRFIKLSFYNLSLADYAVDMFKLFFFLSLVFLRFLFS